MSEIPTLQATPQAHVHLIGGEKGGVGKSLVSRLLAQYFIDHDMPFLGFDTDRSHGSLLRFYAGYASPVLIDRYEALDTIIESSIDQPGRRVLVDLAAQTHDPLGKWMDESGVLDLADVSGLAIHYWHVMDSGRDSVDLLKKLLDRFGHRLHYVLVRNQLRGDDFTQLEQSGEMQRAIDHMEQRAFAVDEKDLLVNAAAGHLERGERHGVRRSSIGGCLGRLARGSTEDGHARIRVDRGPAGG